MSLLPLWWCVVWITILGSHAATAASTDSRRPPNVVFLLADDLGYGDLGCYGQTKIRTPNLDRLASQGMRFTAHYSGHNVCAPSRCVLMTGKHPGHAYIRDNRGGLSSGQEGQEPVPPDTLQLPLLFRARGYAVGGFGKWGLGPVGSTGDPLRQGFTHFFGYNCQAVAHNAYPTSLWENDRRFPLKNPSIAAHQKLPAQADPSKPESYSSYVGPDYAPDLIAERARTFVRNHKDQPFFLYYPTTVPHLALQVPKDALQEYQGAFPEEPYRGQSGYLPHPTPRAAYAAMITRMDKNIGALLGLLDELGLSENTIVIFTSDNGPLYDKLGGTDTDFFRSASHFRGRKGSYYEGGFRVPCIVRWPGKIPASTTSHRVTGFEDWLPTLLELTGAKALPKRSIDGISFAPTLMGRRQSERPFLYRESPGYGGQQCIRMGDWKAIRTNLNPGPKAAQQKPNPLELYNLASDPSEQLNLAGSQPKVVQRLEREMQRQHQASALWPIRWLDEPAVRP